MAAAIRRIGRALEEDAALELIKERHDVRGLDAKRERELALRHRPLRLEVVKDRELRPSQTALGEAAAQAPGRGSGESEDQEAASRAQGRVPDIGLGPGSSGRGIHLRS